MISSRFHSWKVMKHFELIHSSTCMSQIKWSKSCRQTNQSCYENRCPVFGYQHHSFKLARTFQVPLTAPKPIHGAHLKCFDWPNNKVNAISLSSTIISFHFIWFDLMYGKSVFDNTAEVSTFELFTKSNAFPFISVDRLCFRYNFPK